MNGTTVNTNDHSHVASRPSLDFSDTEGEELQEHAGDYSTRFEELMSDGEEESNIHVSDEEEDHGFVYNGVDSEPKGGYREQLRDLLGPDHEEDELDAAEVEHSLVVNNGEHEKLATLMGDEAGVDVPHIEVLSDDSPSTSSLSSPPYGSGLNGSNTPSKIYHPFLHPTISRLRSTTPQASRIPSSRSMGSINSFARDDPSAAPSHFSELSRMSSGDGAESRADRDREVFRWTQLRVVGEYLYAKHPQKASALLGTGNFGSPTVLAANGLICVGTDSGQVLVFDFKQNFQCICGAETPDRSVGSVTALALSFDHTFIAMGHASGHIQLYDLNNPKMPARFVAPTTLAEVVSGRQEGHLLGSRIVNVGFIAGKHTAFVSSDDHGLAFYHRLGKVLFVDAIDVLRILGKYPDIESSVPPAPASGPHFFRRRKSRVTSTILAMGPLPLGTSSHPTDQYNLIALLTPIKLVIVGLKPTPKTWYRRHRESDEEVMSKSKFKGALAWYPSVTAGNAVTIEQESKRSKPNGVDHGPSTMPMLVYSWGDTLNLMRVSETKAVQQIRNSRTGKVQNIEVGRVVFEESSRWTAGGDVLSLQWLNVNQVVVLTPSALEVYDVRTLKLVEHVPYNAWSLVSPILSHTTNGAVSYSDAITEVAHSVRVYKGKIFILAQHEVQVGTLLTWADRILSYVESGDFLSAIDLTRSYYLGDAPGNRNGLPDTAVKLKEVVGEKMRELMVASAHYAFSEDRMTDGTHVTPDGRGVDRTFLFEGLVATCTRACIALDDFDFLFEDLFQYYDSNAIARIFLAQLEPFILEGTVRHVPPRITQRLIGLHDDDHRPDLAERVIWHIDPDCLDINQAITLCQNYRLYDALMYVYTRALKDYVSPVVELLSLIRQVQQYRKAHREGSPPAAYADEEAIEPIVLNAYKIYPYLADVLSGLTYPSEEPLPEEEAFQAKNDIYTFLFFGRSSMWPPGEGGRLILTSDEENGVEPTYPYTRILLRFDPEAFLHTLDLAFEDAYFNDKTRRVSRLVIVKILLEITNSSGLSPAEFTFVNIFLARNIPKYVQFIEIPPSALHTILIGLAEDPDHSTREDRQLAAEYLLSAYTPHESDRIMVLFEQAGFYRILRTWYRQERQWSSLLLSYLDDPDMSPTNVFPSVNEVLDVALRSNKGALPKELGATVTDSLGSLLHASVVSTAALLDKYMPALHERALEALGLDAEHEHFAYLRYLLGSPQTGEEYGIESRKGGPSLNLLPRLRQLYISLLCRLESTGVIEALTYLPSDFLDATEMMQTCEKHEVYDAVVWILNRNGDPQSALTKAEAFDRVLSTRVADQLTSSLVEAETAIHTSLSALESIGRTTVSICLERSKPTSSVEVPLEDIWFQLLRSQIDSVQRVASCCSPEALNPASEDPTREMALQQQTLTSLRSLVQRTFGSLMSISSTKAVSFPRLFRRLVESASASHVSKHTLYAEFRTILTGMLDSFRSEGDLLIITKRLVDRDLFATIEELTQDRLQGWAPSQGTCRSCGEVFLNAKKTSTSGESDFGSAVPIIVSRTGAIYHSQCLPPDFPTNTSIVH
ncbi:predicted protein [Sparassis crispa]|uniref:Vacuolar protein sorting-associated protein 8 central domain-containing protein n=1 Tax=Sparassis crispa TaxID=139825 RepID=A0A401GEQ7_9APHY|nr:predicted protein [Sparassis crispa]GBE80615.1 predicted protein [Sparassis crispa]